MINKYKLPNDFIPFKEVIICNNTFINGLVILTVNGFPSFFIGKSDFPIIWLTILTSNKNFYKIIIKNKSFNKELQINENKTNTNIVYKNKVLININKITDDKILIDKLDLRPFGYNIHGDKNELFIGDKELKENIFENITNMIDIGNNTSLTTRGNIDFYKL